MKSPLFTLMIAGAALFLGPAGAGAQGFPNGFHTRITMVLGGPPAEVQRHLSIPSPVYPSDMVRAGVGQTITIQFRLASGGAVEEVTDVTKAARPPERAFVESALQAVKSWRFAPRPANNQDGSSVLLTATIAFELP